MFDYSTSFSFLWPFYFEFLTIEITFYLLVFQGHVSVGVGNFGGLSLKLQVLSISWISTKFICWKFCLCCYCSLGFLEMCTYIGMRISVCTLFVDQFWMGITYVTSCQMTGVPEVYQRTYSWWEYWSTDGGHTFWCKFLFYGILMKEVSLCCLIYFCRNYWNLALSFALFCAPLMEEQETYSSSTSLWLQLLEQRWKGGSDISTSLIHQYLIFSFLSFFYFIFPS